MGVNRAIVEAHERGIVTSTTLMANGSAFDDAVSLAQSRPRLGVGCHIVLVDGVPLVRETGSHSLLDPSSTTRTQRFREGISKFAALALLGRLVPDEIEAEAASQIGKLQSSGIAVTHLDSHKHTHMFPQVFKPLLRAARTCGVKAIRNPFERIRTSQLAAQPLLQAFRQELPEGLKVIGRNQLLQWVQQKRFFCIRVHQHRIEIAPLAGKRPYRVRSHILACYKAAAAP